MKNTENIDFKMFNEPCPHREFCGGCLYNGEGYEYSLKMKEGESRFNFRDKGVDITEVYQGMVGCPEDWRFSYRNKMEYTFGDFVKDGDLQLGMHKKGNYMSLLTVDHCQLVPEDFNKILRFTLDFAAASGLKHYHKKTHQGVWRNLIVRRGVRTKELLVDIVTSSECDGVLVASGGVFGGASGGADSAVCDAAGGGIFDAQTWKDGLLGLELDSEIVGIMHTINDGIADTVACDEQRILFGRDYYYEEICGLKFKVGIFSFFQTNVDAVERLYTEALSLLPDLKGKVVYDLFCGTGTISQIAAGSAAEVYGVEIVEDSVEAAKVNAELNGIKNCRFICGDVFEVLTKAGTEAEGIEVKREESGGTEYEVKSLATPDVIIVDPPRVGLRTKTVNHLASYGVPEILYISCNPKTLDMDLADFALLGYEAEYVKFYDNFPWTKHVECVCLLDKKKPKGYVEIGVDAEDYYRIKDSKEER